MKKLLLLACALLSVPFLSSANDVGGDGALASDNQNYSTQRVHRYQRLSYYRPLQTYYGRGYVVRYDYNGVKYQNARVDPRGVYATAVGRQVDFQNPPVRYV